MCLSGPEVFYGLLAASLQSKLVLYEQVTDLLLILPAYWLFGDFLYYLER